MDHEKTCRKLLRFDPAEQILKEYYLHFHTFYPMQNLPLLLPDMDGSAWGMGRDSYNRLKELAALHTPFELVEEDHFSPGCDIRIMKNLRYTHVTDHQHTFFEIMYILRGTCTNTIDGHAATMQTGDLCIIPPKVKHDILVASDCVLINVLIRTSTFTDTFIPLLKSTNLLSDFFNEILYNNTYRKYLMFHTGNDTSVQDLVLEMYEEQQEGGPYISSILNGLLITFFGRLLKNHEADVEFPADYVEKYATVPDIIRHIQEHCQDITLNSCAGEFHFNPQYLSALLKKHTGQTFQSILTGIRMKEAGRLLKKSDECVSRIAQEVGYQDASYFMKVFKKYYGCTPSGYRQLQ